MTCDFLSSRRELKKIGSLTINFGCVQKWVKFVGVTSMLVLEEVYFDQFGTQYNFDFISSFHEDVPKIMKGSDKTSKRTFMGVVGSKEKDLVVKWKVVCKLKEIEQGDLLRDLKVVNTCLIPKQM